MSFWYILLSLSQVDRPSSQKGDNMDDLSYINLSILSSAMGWWIMMSTNGN